MSYCNYGYGLPRQIIHRVTGKPLAEFARERIFLPLGTGDGSYDVPESVAHRRVKRRAGVPHDWVGEFQFPELMCGGSGAYSTVLDMAVFGQTFLNGAGLATREY